MSKILVAVIRVQTVVHNLNAACKSEINEPASRSLDLEAGFCVSVQILVKSVQIMAKSVQIILKNVQKIHKSVQITSESVQKNYNLLGNVVLATWNGSSLDEKGTSRTANAKSCARNSYFSKTSGPQLAEPKPCCL